MKNYISLIATAILSSLGLIAFLVSPILLIWLSWSLVWRICLTGLLTALLSFVAWWFIFNIFSNTKRYEKEEK